MTPGGKPYREAEVAEMKLVIEAQHRRNQEG